MTTVSVQITLHNQNWQEAVLILLLDTRLSYPVVVLVLYAETWRDCGASKRRLDFAVEVNSDLKRSKLNSL